MSINKVLLLTVCTGLFLMGPGAVFSNVLADDSFEEISTEERLYVRGLISKVKLENLEISVRPPKGKAITIQFTPETILEGVSGIDKLEKKQQVKVWYVIEDDENRAIKVFKMMELGC